MKQKLPPRQSKARNSSSAFHGQVLSPPSHTTVAGKAKIIAVPAPTFPDPHTDMSLGSLGVSCVPSQILVHPQPTLSSVRNRNSLDFVQALPSRNENIPWVSTLNSAPMQSTPSHWLLGRKLTEFQQKS